MALQLTASWWRARPWYHWHSSQALRAVRGSRAAAERPIRWAAGHVTLFEYLAAGYVLMLSFAVLRAMSGVPHAVGSGGRHWVHVSWLAVALVMCLVAFWAFWPYRAVDWNAFRFMNALAIPALLYSFTSVLIPLDPSAVASWREHFYRVRSRLFATGTGFMVAVTISNQTALGVSPTHPSQLGNYALIMMFLTGLAVPKPFAQAVLALAFPAFTALYFLTMMIEPDSVFRPAP